MEPKGVKSLLALTNSDPHTCLFRIAIHYAQTGRHVWFISPTRFDKTPKDIRPPDKEVLQLMTFIYLRHLGDLAKHLNGLHLWQRAPQVIIVTQFETYCGDLSADTFGDKSAFLCSALLDSAAISSRKTGGDTLVLLAMTKDPELVKYRHKVQILVDLYVQQSEVMCNDLFDRTISFFK